MEQEESAAKVGDGETAGCEGCGLPLAQALGEAGACRCPGGLRKPSEFSETSAWLFEVWKDMRKRDQAVLAGLHSRFASIIECAESIITEAGFEGSVKEVLQHYPDELMTDQEEHISVMLCLFRSKKEVVECGGRKVTLDSTPFVESLKLLVAINKSSPQMVKRFFDHRKFAALSMRYETVTPPTGELIATFYPGNFLADFIATNGAGYRY